MRPTDKFGTFRSTSGGVEVDAAALLDTEVAIIEDEVGEAEVEVITGEDVCEEVFVEVVAQNPCGKKERSPNETTRARRIK